MLKKVLITGSCGFIFSNFVRNILYNHKNKYKFFSIDKIVAANSLNNIYANPHHELHIGDVADVHFVDVVFQKTKPDYVIHGAAESFVDDSINNANPFVLSNVLGTQVIVNACVKYNVKKLIFISTDEVLGQLGENDQAWAEDQPIAPRNPYSASKAAGELIVKAANVSHGLQYNITRSCNNFGPRQSTKNLIPKTIKNILSGIEIPIYGTGSQIREWIYVTDNCTAILDVLENGLPNEIYNVSAGYEISNIELVQKICNIMETGYDLISFIKDPRPGHDFRYSINSSKIKGLGWKPQFSFSKGLKTTVDWYLNNKWFLK